MNIRTDEVHTSSKRINNVFHELYADIHVLNSVFMVRGVVGLHAMRPLGRMRTLPHQHAKPEKRK